MSMNFSEFRRWLGAEPRSGDPEFLRARESAPEFKQAAAEAERFEKKLERALALPVQARLVDEIKSVAAAPVEPPERKNWWPLALAASVLIAVGAAGMAWKANRSWDSVEHYVLDHYRHDGPRLVERSASVTDGEVQSVLARLDVQAAPALSAIVGVIKYCPTPDGRGVHMVLNTDSGPVTVIYMPDTEVRDRETFRFDHMEAILVDLDRGSAAIIGPENRALSSLYATVHDSILPSPGSS